MEDNKVIRLFKLSIRLHQILLVVIAVILFLLGFFLDRIFFQTKFLDYSYKKILENFDGDIKTDDLKKAAEDGMLRQLKDPYAVFAGKDYYDNYNKKEIDYKIEIKNFNQGIVLIKMDEFPLNLIEQIKNISEVKSGDIKGMIIDLRNNLGGDFETAVSLANEFLKSGVIVKEKIKGEAEKIYRANKHGAFINIPLAIIQSRETSSAAEIFSAAIKENDRGQIIGERSYGKGMEGQWFELSDGSAIHFSVGKWFTPQGNWINGKGVEPTINTSDNPTTQADEEIQKALETIKGIGN